MYDKILSDYSTHELVQICKVLNREYNIYEPDDVRWQRVRYAFYRTKDSDFIKLQEETFSNEFINRLMLKYYACERVVKYHFIKYLKNGIHDIVAFEMSIGDSRIDICRINGKLCAYEIKTEYDNYDRLQTQMEDYFKAFERVYIIVPIQNAKIVQEYIPRQCGIITYRLDKDNNMIFSYKRSAQDNKCDINFCLKSLSCNDLIKILKLLHLKPSKTKNENLSLLLSVSEKKNLWFVYKLFLRDKYKEQWMYLKSNFEKILPIDCQSFFSSKMNPELLYEKEKNHMAVW